MIKRLDSFMSLETEILHSPFFPEEIREGDPISLKLISSSETIDLKIWSYSPFGIEVLSAPNIPLKKADNCNLILRLGNQDLSIRGYVVSSEYFFKEKKLIAIRTFRQDKEKNPDLNRRQSTRWVCQDSYLPTGTAANPAKYNDFIIFRIDNISIGGARLLTSMRNKLVAVGQRLDTTISLPMVGSIQASLLIKHIDSIHYNDKPTLVLGTEFIKPDAVLLSSIAEYLFGFAENISLLSLKKEGFPIPSAYNYKNLDFSYVKSEDDYKEVLRLRAKAYKHDQKISAETTPEEMSDEFDARARILIVRHKGKIIGSVRAMFHEENDSTHHERFLSFPENFPKKVDCVEASRLCTDPEYRGGDISLQLVAHLTLTAIKSGRRYMYGSASSSMIDFWKTAGWQSTGVKFNNASLSNIEHLLLLCDTAKAALGYQVSPKAWKKIYLPLVDYMSTQEIINPSPFEKLRISLFKGIGALL